MSKFKSILIVIALYTFSVNCSYGQGCSDAGFCTIESFKPSSSDSLDVLINQIKIGAFFGNADNSILVYGNSLEYSRQLNQQFGFDVKITSLAQNGNGISVIGFSDIFLNTNYKVGNKIKLTLGGKIPLSKANKRYNNLPLPMDYQTSLGTFDLVFGVGYEVKNIQLVLAIQQPLTQNDNQFMATDYPIDSKLRTFQPTNKFKRSGDVLLRASYPISMSSKFKLTPSILPIYHLRNDRYTNESNKIIEIDGSRGLTLNANLYLDYKINSKNVIQINMGMPFITRTSRPDGLTRHFIANLEYRIKF
jgi:hypothetical protein